MLYSLSPTFDSGIKAIGPTAGKGGGMVIEEGSVFILDIVSVDTGKLVNRSAVEMPDVVTMDQLPPAMVKAFSSSGESSDVILLSPELWAIISSFSLPDHELYEVAFNFKTGVLREGYRCLALRGSLKEVMSYPDSIYKEIDFMNGMQTTVYSGIINSGNELVNRQNELLQEQKGLIVDVFKIEEEYDLFWAGMNRIFISEKLASNLKGNGLISIKIIPFKKFDIQKISRDA